MSFISKIEKGMPTLIVATPPFYNIATNAEKILGTNLGTAKESVLFFLQASQGIVSGITAALAIATTYAFAKHVVWPHLPEVKQQLVMMRRRLRR